MNPRSIKNTGVSFEQQKDEVSKITVFEQQSDGIEENIPLLFSDDPIAQLTSIRNFTKYLLDHDYILPPEYFERTVELFQKHADQEEFIQSILLLYRRCTGFQSDMQEFLSDLNVIELVIPFFPAPDVLAILGNLAIPNLSNRERLLSTGILGSIIPLITLNITEEQQTDFIVFDYAVNLVNCLVLHSDDFDYSNWTEEIIAIFDILYEDYGNSIPFEQNKTIIKAFSDYIECDEVFMNNFREKGYLQKFFEVEFPDEDNVKEIYLLTATICLSIVNFYQNDGAHFLYDIHIVDWISLKLYHPSEKVRETCYSILSSMIQNITPSFQLINDCISNDFVIRSIDSIKSSIKYPLKISILEFLCSLFNRSSNSNIASLIQEKVLDEILDNVILFEDQFDKANLILEAILRFRDFYANITDHFEEEDIEEETAKLIGKYQEIRDNEEFLEWMDDLWDEVENSPDQDDSVIQTLLFELNEIKMFLDL